MAKTSILVTGGAGYIGSHASKYLAAHGVTPVTLDNLSAGHADAVRWGPLVRADVRDVATVTTALKDHGIKAVMHFAASAYVGESVRDPSHYYDNNVGGMIALLKACRRADVVHFVLSSSCATYGEPVDLPITEDAPQQPVNPYGWTKLICEQMLADHHRAYGLAHVILRYFNACGADPGGELFERHSPETHLIPLALLTAAGRRPHLDIFGSDYATADGTCIRDYIHVTDLARAHLSAVRHLQAGGGNLALNLGSGRGQSISDVVAAVQRFTGRPLPIRLQPRRAGDPAELFADPARARQSLGFTTRRADLDTIIRDAAPGFGLELSHELCA